MLYLKKEQAKRHLHTRIEQLNIFLITDFLGAFDLLV